MTNFIDFHLHPPVEALLHGPLAPFLDGLRAVVPRPVEVEAIEDIAQWYRDHDAKAVLLGWHGGAGSPTSPLDGGKIAKLVAVAPDVFKGFGAADPSLGAAAVGAIHEIARMGLDGLSFHPAAQRIEASHRSMESLWETAAEHDLVCVVHSGGTRLGAGRLGGAGIMLAPARPVHVDTVAAEFPDLRIVLAHTGQLWLDEALAVVRHKANVWLDISGQDPASMSPELIDAIGGELSERVLFGSDYPFASTPLEWIAAWNDLGMPENVTRQVLHDNAAAVLGWD